MRTILVVYGLTQYPLRSTVEDHLYSFQRYSGARCFYANVLLGPIPNWMRRVGYDAIVFHTTLLSAMRWAPSLSPTLRERCLALRDVPAVRAAMPQDEFLRSDDLCAFVDDMAVDVVFSVSPESEWSKIYGGIDRDRVRFEPTLTGYLDERTLERIDAIVGEDGERPIDVFYRAGAERPYLGRHGMLKTEIAHAGRREAQTRGMTTDISLSPADTLFGDDWHRALAASRWTLGVEGGASILDRDGTIREATDTYVATHSGADFDEVEAACFPGRDGELALYAISPRHLEACATRTGQILVEGGYSGILEPERHFLPLRPDLSNLADVLERARDEEVRRAMTDAAYEDIVASGSYTYRSFVEHVDRVLLTGSERRGGPLVAAACAAARIRDRLSWLRIALRHRRTRGWLRR